MSRMSQIIEALEAERAELQARLAWIDAQIDEFRRHDAAAKGASNDGGTTRRKRTPATATATARSTKRPRTSRSAGQGSDMRSQIVAYLNAHPNSTAGDIATGLGLKRNSTSTRLSQMAKEGLVTKAERGYAAK